MAPPSKTDWSLEWSDSQSEYSGSDFTSAAAINRGQKLYVNNIRNQLLMLIESAQVLVRGMKRLWTTSFGANI